jgi:hypothetical protein
MECDEMLDIHIVYIMFGWKSNIQGYWEDLPSVPDVFQPIRLPIILPYTAY